MPTNKTSSAYSSFWYFSIWLPILCFILIQMGYLDFVPIWDGRWYFEFLYRAMSQPFNVLNYNLSGHLSFAYALMVAFTQWVDFGNIQLFHILQILIGSVGIYSFKKILDFIFGSDFKIEILLLTLIFSMNPTMLGNSISATLDFPVTAFILAMIAASLYGQYALFALFAVLSIFTRETGLGFYLAYTVPFLIVFFIRTRKFDFGHFRPLALIISPAIAYILYILYRYVQPSTFIWGGDTTSTTSLAKLFLKYDLSNPYVITHLLQVFVLNFGWIFTLAIFLHLGGKGILWLYSFIFNKKSFSLHRPLSIRWDAFGLLIATFIPNAIVLFNYITFPIPRYRIPLIPLFLIFGFYSFQVLLQKRKLVRQGLLALIVVLTFIQNFYTIDKVSKDTFGTFDFGSHKIICMKRITTREPDCGRDQVVYNLQYSNVLALADMAVKKMIPDEKGQIHIISDVDSNHPFIFSNIDLGKRLITFEKIGNGIVKPFLYTMDRRHLSHDYTPVSLISELSPADLPQRLYYLKYPMFGEEFYELLKLERKGYHLTSRTTLDHYGYTADLLVLDLAQP